MIQVRDKEAPARDLLQLLEAVAESVGNKVPVLVDDRGRHFPGGAGGRNASGRSSCRPVRRAG
jgi:hypothetical protein